MQQITGNNQKTGRFLQVPYLQIRNNSAVLYSRYADAPPKKNNFNNLYSDFSPADNFGDSQTYSGIVTKGAKKSMAKVISLMVQSTPVQPMIDPYTGKSRKFKMNFITLTVADNTRNITASEAHKTLLEPMLKHFRDVYGMKSYIWKAELQKRGQIHYHLTTDFYIPKEKLQSKWNTLQQKNGLLDDFHKRFGRYNAPSTKVHHVYKMRNIEAYLVKYLQKNGGRDKVADRWVQRFRLDAITHGPGVAPFTTLPKNYFDHILLSYTKGKIWDCSQNLKIGKYYTTLLDSVNVDRIETLVKQKAARVEYNEHFTMVFFNNIPAASILSVADQAEYKNHLDGIRNFDVTAYRNRDKLPEKVAVCAPLRPPKSNAVQTRLLFRLSA